jgi:hypothetical protein
LEKLWQKNFSKIIRKKIYIRKKFCKKLLKNITFWQNLMHKSFGRKFGKNILGKQKSFFEKLWQKIFSKIIGCTKVFRQKYYAEKGNRKVLEV